MASTLCGFTWHCCCCWSCVATYSSHARASISVIGRTNASVLPLPVHASTAASLFVQRMGTVAACSAAHQQPQLQLRERPSVVAHNKKNKNDSDDDDDKKQNNDNNNMYATPTCTQPTCTGVHPVKPICLSSCRLCARSGGCSCSKPTRRTLPLHGGGAIAAGPQRNARA